MISEMTMKIRMRRKIFFGRKAALGLGDKMMKYIIVGLMLPGLVLGFFLFAFTFRTPYIPEQLDMVIQQSRFSNVCFNYNDPDIMRSYPGVIDLARFNSQELNSCFSVDKKSNGRAYGLQLNYDEEEKKLYTSNWAGNKDIRYIRDRQVLVYDENGIRKANLRIYCQ